MARLVIAFGGNALIREDERGTWPEQTGHALEAARAIARMGRADQVVLTHGNGPQVGALAMQQAIGEPHAPALPLDVLDAMTQGEIGYLLQQALTAVDPSLPTATVLTRVLVAEDDPAFAADPTKPIGAFFAEDEARRLAHDRGWHVAPDAGRGWRRMVPSPRPLRIIEVDHVRRLAEAGVLVIAAGGGGIPVAWREGSSSGSTPSSTRIAARPSSPCAGGRPARAHHQRAARGDRLRHAGVARCAAPHASPMRCATSKRASSRPGSMGPKIEGATRFVSAGGSAVIADAAHLATAVRGHHGTWIVPDGDGPSVFASAPVAA